MMAAIKKGPLAVAISANNKFIHSYKSGVIDSSECDTNIDHAVLAVGYGTDARTGLDYWIILNSWASYWGENGYVKIAIVDG